LAPRGFEPGRPVILALLFLTAFRLGAAPGASADSDLFSRAQALHRGGDWKGALDALRALRTDFSESALVPRSLSLGVRVASAAGDSYTARWFMDRLLATGQESEEARECALLLADEAYGRGDRTLAAEYYRIALDLWPAADAGAVFSRLLLRLSEIALYQEKDARAARGYHGRVVSSLLSAEERVLYEMLRARLRWDAIRPTDLGMRDGNISALRIDGDDLWVGTWNGGVARISLSTGDVQSAVSGERGLAADTVRSIEAAGNRIWVGTFQGLSYYSKTTSRWYGVPFFSGADPMKVTSVREIGGALYVGTLGSGLYRMRESPESWERISEGALPGDSVNCIAPLPGGREVLIGTLGLGLLILDPAAGTLRGLSESHPEFEPRNITCLLADPTDGLWIGTYGDGLWRLPPDGGTIRRYGKSTGELRDDWILCAAGTPEALYFGTFGGGVGVRARADGGWRTLGVSDGILSQDVAAAAAGLSRVFFGTLGQGIAVLWESESGSHAQP
jgi:hypothetical protein